MTNQPTWRRIANLGDVNPLDYGGLYVYIDRTKQYEAEIELLDVADTEDEQPQWKIYRTPIDRCTFVDGVLSDNKFHPELPAWFAKSLPSIAETAGIDELALITALCGEDIVQRAEAYRDIASYHGWENFDAYPRMYAKRSELPRRWQR